MGSIPVRLDRSSRLLLKAFRLLRRDGEGETLPRTKFKYGDEVSDGLRSNVIVAVALWIMRNFPEAPPIVQAPDGSVEPDHPLAKLLREPNEYYSGGALRSAWALDYAIQGNAFCDIERGGRGNAPTALYYQPWAHITPKGTSGKLITHYEQQTDKGQTRRLNREDCVHFRYGLDPRNQRQGFVPLAALVREVFTDDEAANFTAAMLRNFGMPGAVIQPRDENEAIGPGLADKIKTYWRRMLRGDNRGEPIVLSGRVAIEPFEVDLAKVNIDKLRQIPEERVSAVLGIPAAVVGFGTGLEQTKVGATMAEMRELAYENVIVPMHRVFADELTARLLPEFETREGYRVAFDLSDVRVLQEDEERRGRRITALWDSGLITRAVAKGELGYEPDRGDDVYKLGMSDLLVPAGTAPPAGAIAASLDTPDWIRKALSAPRPPGKADSARDRRIELITRFADDRDALAPVFADRLRKMFVRIGADLAREWADEQVQLNSGNGSRKAELPEADRALIDRLLLGYTMPTPDYEGHYLRVGKQTVETINATLGVNTMLSEPMERELIRSGGMRKGLLDLTEDTRQAMYRSVSAGREAGDGVRVLADRIRDDIPAGPWNSVEYRSELIARAETGYAQNVASLTAYQEADTITAVEIFDAQAGDTHDPECLRLAGQIMSVEEASQVEPLQHPNCSRGFAPIVESAAVEA